MQGIKQYGNTCKAAAKGVSFSHHLYERDQEQYRKHLSDFLREYAVSLQEAKRFDDASNAGAEAVALSRHLYERDGGQYWEALSHTLYYTTTVLHCKLSSDFTMHVRLLPKI